MGVTLKMEELHDLATISINAWAKHHPLDPEAIEVLEELNSHYMLALITDFDHPPFIYSIIQRYNLDQYFRCIIISGEEGVSKPNPKMFIRALDETGLRSEEVVYVGDSIEHDVEGASGVGMIPIHIKREQIKKVIKNGKNKGYIINQLKILPNLLLSLRL
ncbi:Phosphoglycolate phosphatase [Candidatus Lokiarchaeum ossiferum]|uniref:Phosphoglycolate phosphatase n=1 Tax=Candidatus Lokiarchaeum ossiferum TaxID=2951803 RepID=A0ABY6HYC4_9ARCH|nr:Phosphoglycolate phosphatase [Candidatus Lokiarchaeum sp. B-35]